MQFSPNDMMAQMSPRAIAKENARFMSKVYMWMTIGVAVSALIAYYVAANPQIMMAIFGNTILRWTVMLSPFAFLIFMNVKIASMRASTATFIFLAFASVLGLSMSSIFVAYQMGQITSAFMLTSGAFLGLSAFGYFTRIDLGPIGTFCTMALFGIIGWMILGWFFPSLMGGQASYIFNIAGLVIFCGLTAYDTQKIKQMNIIGNEGTEEDHKEAILGATKLYLDFINLFMFILRLSGGSRD